MKKVLVMLLCLTLTLGILPNSVRADETVDCTVSTAQQLKEAFENAQDGYRIQLSADFSYSYNDLGTINVEKDVTLDFNGHKITTNTGLFDVAEDGKLTLVKAQIDSTYENRIYGLINYVYGELVIESTEGNGFDSRSDSSGCVDVVEYNYGKITIKDGKFYPGYCIIYENYGDILIENAYCETPKDGGYVVGYLEDGNPTLTIKNGEYITGSYIISGIECGTVEIEDGKYTSTYECFDDVDGGTLTIKGGTFNAGDEENQESVFDIYSGSIPTVVNIEGGTFNSNYYTIWANDEAEVNISGGTFTSDTVVVYGCDNSKFNLSGGSFTNKSGEKAIELNDDSSVTIVEGYRAVPSDWQESDASKVEVVPDIIKVNFYVEGKLWKQVEAKSTEIDFPEEPTHSQGYDFVYWENESGERVDSLVKIADGTNLYGVFTDRTYVLTFIDKDTTTTKNVNITTPLGQVEGLDRVDNGDGFYGWKYGNEIVNQDTTTPVYSDLTLYAIYSGDVTNYQELIDAINNKQEAIRFGDDIVVTAEVVVDYDCVIDGNGFGLIRPEDYKGYLLSVVNGVEGGQDDSEVEKTGTTLIVRNAYIDGKNYEADNSAVIANESTVLVMNNVTVKNNKTTYYGWVSKGENRFYKHLEGNGGGIYVSETATVELTDCTLEGNYAKGGGGAIYFEGIDSATLTNCTIQNNYSEDEGGGIFGQEGEDEDAIMNITIDNCKVLSNTTDSYWGGGGIAICHTSRVNITNSLIDGNYSDSHGGGLLFDHCYIDNDETTIVNITDTTISNNEADDAGGGLDITRSIVHLYGNTSIDHNKARNGGASNSRNGGDDDNTIIYMHDGSSLSYNEATEDGGAVYQWEQVIVMYDDSSLHHNKAGKDGGAVYTSDYGIHQFGGTIHDNYAAGLGGGVYSTCDDSEFVSGMIYDNLAGKAGDDLYNSRTGWNTLYETQPNRNYGSGNRKELGTVDVEFLNDYYDVPLDEISVPYYGWFIDGVEDQEYKYVQVFKRLPNNTWGYVWEYQWVYTGTYSNRYTLEDRVKVSEENDNLGFLDGSLDHTGGKAIWYGLLVAYDANYEGSTDHKYDNLAYAVDDEVEVAENMFTREGYDFVGWNSEPDGSGTAYSPEDVFTIEHSTILYAQWKKFYTVTYVVNSDPQYGVPEDSFVPVDGSHYGYDDQVTVAGELATNQKYAMINGKKVRGTWQFVKWDKEDFIITENTVITGQWQFTPSDDPLAFTGDNNNISLWIAVDCLTLVGLFAVVYAKKRLINTK